MQICTYERSALSEKIETSIFELRSKCKTTDFIYCSSTYCTFETGSVYIHAVNFELQSFLRFLTFHHFELQPVS